MLAAVRWPFLPPLDGHTENKQILREIRQTVGSLADCCSIGFKFLDKFKGGVGFWSLWIHCALYAILSWLKTASAVAAAQKGDQRSMMMTQRGERRRHWLRFCAFSEQMKIETIANGKAGRTQSRTKSQPEDDTRFRKASRFPFITRKLSLASAEKGEERNR